jgi:hypothetical protein
MLTVSGSTPETYNRHHRRRLRAFGRGRVLTTALVPAPLQLVGHPRERAIRNAVNEAMSEAASCIVCRERVSRPGAFLCAWGDTSTAGIAVAQVCSTCWRDASDDLIELNAARVLQGVVPGGHFLD